MKQRSTEFAAKKAGDINSFRRISQLRFNFAREFYTKVFAYNLALELRVVQRRLQDQYQSLSPLTLKETNDLIRSLSPLAPGSSRKGFDTGYNIIHKPIRLFSPKGFAYQNISFDAAEKFIRDHKIVVSQKRLGQIKPKMLVAIENPSKKRRELSAVVPREDYSFLKKSIPVTSDALRAEAERLKNIVSIHRAGGDEIEAEEMAAELERVEEEIKKRDLEKKKN
jgi:(2Fe-2S) ferredoxin